MAINKIAVQNSSEPIRYVLIGVLVVAAFFGAYKFASASSARSAAQVVAASGAPASTGGAASAAGGCCGGGASGAAAGGAASGGCCGGSATASKPVVGSATISGGVQKIDVTVTTIYTPNVIKLKAGVPAEINFSSSQSCAAIVQSADLGFQEDLTTGPKTVKLQGLKAGTYNFACSMNMVQGQIVVQ